MKKFLRIVGLLIILLMVSLFSFYLLKNESLPEGTPSSEADALATSMLTAMNKSAWDSTKLVSWTFRGKHHYEWDRVKHEVTMTWDDKTVRFNPETREGTMSQEGKSLTTEEEAGLLQYAWDNFNNDSFWLAAPYKVFDPGTERSLVTTADGRAGLMVTYTIGGTTPGDSYVWILGNDLKPVACKMWVKILPLGGMEFSWENYQTLSSGAQVAINHKAYGLLNIDLKNIE